MSNNGSVQHPDLSHSPLWRRCLRTLARAALAGGCLAHVAFMLLALAATAPVLVSPAAAQQTFCQPEGSANCGACNVNNGLVACNTIYPADGKQISTFTDLNSGAQSVIVTQKPDSTTHACPAGFVTQADGSCSSLSQTQGQLLSGSTANLGAPNLGCTTGANGNTSCSGCSVNSGSYICNGTDPKTGATFKSVTNLATGDTNTGRIMGTATSGPCPSGYGNQGAFCVAGNSSQSSSLLQAATAPKTPTPTTSPTTPVATTPTPPTTPVTATTPTTPPTTTPVKATTPIPTPTKPVLTAKQAKQQALAEAQKKKIATDPKAAALALKRDQTIEKKAEATHNTKVEETAKARDKLAEHTIVKAGPKVQVQVKQQLQQQAKKVQVTTPVKTRTAPVIKPKCLGKKCPA